MTAILAWGLRVWALSRVALAVMWMFGPFGFQKNVVNSLAITITRHVTIGSLSELVTGPIVDARLDEPVLNRQLGDLSTAYSHTPDVSSGALGDVNFGWSVQFSSLTEPQSWAWTALHVIPLVTAGVLWWMLADSVASSRRTTIFTRRTARRLTAAGIVVAGGSVVTSVATWGFLHWVNGTSNLAGHIELLGYTLQSVPWAYVTTGIALGALGYVWHQGVMLRRDVEGLV